jgi:hydroxymethylbilane synthase
VLIRAATRGSPLALWQTQHVAALLRGVDASIEVEPVVITTTADQRLDVTIAEMGGKGVFVKEVQVAVLDGRADIAVHSAKDLPSSTLPELVIAAVPDRGDPRDALVGCTLDELGPESHVATGSARRQAQLAHRRPGLRFSPLRGSIATRLEKAEGFDAIVVASAALERLGLSDRAAEILDPEVMLPQVGQGSLAVEARADDADLLSVLSAIDHSRTHRALDAERAFLAELGGDCDLPAGAYATLHGDADDEIVRVDALVAALDGSSLLRERVEARDGVAAARSAARRLMDDMGGAELLAGL